MDTIRSLRLFGSFFTVAVLVLGVVLAIGLWSRAEAAPDGLSAVKHAMQRYENPKKAEKDGWVTVPGLDYCFEKPGVGGMGYHYINTEMLDTTVDELRPEALVYAPREHGGLELVAVEWIVPAAQWDAEGHASNPQAFGQTFHLNSSLGVYVLHAWLFKENPEGMFEDWNPLVSCP